MILNTLVEWLKNRPKDDRYCGTSATVFSVIIG
jgi:hypothetical protein